MGDFCKDWIFNRRHQQRRREVIPLMRLEPPLTRSTVDRRGEPPKYAQVLSDVMGIEKTLAEVNARISAAFKPAIPDNFFRADVFRSVGERPLRILSLGISYASWTYICLTKASLR